jgi:hypothetical protein
VVKTTLAACAAAVTLASPAAGAQAFTFEATAPDFAVTIPGVPPISMEPHPMQGAHPHLRYMGAKGPYTVSIITPSAERGMSALQCAGATVRSLAARPNVPPSDQFYKARLDDNTFVAIYAAQMPGFLQLHAHLLSAAGGAHCVEVHVSKIATSTDEVAPWFGGFGEARISARGTR